MSIEIVIDPNVRVEGGRTYAGFEDVLGGFVADLAEGLAVTVVEDETDVIGSATVYSVDRDRQLVYLSVDWRSLHPRPLESMLSRTPLVKVRYVTPRGEQRPAVMTGNDLLASAS